jgi:hypothetical protein
MYGDGKTAVVSGPWWEKRVKSTQWPVIGYLPQTMGTRAEPHRENKHKLICNGRCQGHDIN